jgi:hypothetical protein
MNRFTEEVTMAEATQAAAEKPDCLRVWLEGDSDKLKVGTSSRVGVQLHSPGDDAKWDELNLLVVVSISQARFVKQHELKFRKSENPDPIYLDVTPSRSGEHDIRVSIYLARELTLLEERVYSVMAQETHQD